MARGPLRQAVDRIYADGLLHSITDVEQATRHLTMPGIAARVVERDRRRRNPQPRKQPLPEYRVIVSGHRGRVRKVLASMMAANELVRIDIGVYQRAPSNGHGA